MAQAAKPETGAGVLYVVATPIGNLRDITLRALEVLNEVDLIACEDTRHTARLLAAHGIRRPLISYFEHNEQRRTIELVARLRGGERIAVVTDAGTPAISDPGYRLVRAALEAGYTVRAVPGPSAVIAALSIAGLPTDRFIFEGFLPPRPAAREARLRELRSESRTMVFFEAARRLPQTLATMVHCWGAMREVAVVRETTKVFEETVRGNLGELARRAAKEPLRGEATLVVAGQNGQAEPVPQAAAALDIRDLLEAGVEPRAAAKVIARLTGRSSREIYQQALRDKPGRRDEG